MRSRVGFEPKLWLKPHSSCHCAALPPKSAWAGLLQNLEWCLSVIGQDGRKASIWHWCLLILWNSRYIPFFSVQKRSAHGGAVLCLETEKFKFQPWERMTPEVEVRSLLLIFIPEKQAHASQGCTDGSSEWKSRALPVPARSLRARWAKHQALKGLFGRQSKKWYA